MLSRCVRRFLNSLAVKLPRVCPLSERHNDIYVTFLFIRTLSPCAHRALISARLFLLIMTTQTAMMGQSMAYNCQNTQQIREKIKIVFGRNCTMTDDILLKRYAMSGDGELVMILK